MWVKIHTCLINQVCIMIVKSSGQAWQDQGQVGGMQALLETRMEDVKKSLKGDMGEHTGMESEPGVMELMEHDRSTNARPKRRR